MSESTVLSLVVFDNAELERVSSCVMFLAVCVSEHRRQRA